MATSRFVLNGLAAFIDCGFLTLVFVIGILVFFLNILK
jgi:hypothetical protein